MLFKMLLQDNVKRSNSTTRSHQKSSSFSSGLLHPTPIPPPAAVQSMLRTATEVGNINHAALSSASKANHRRYLPSTRRRSSSFDASFASNQRYKRLARYRQDRPREHLDSNLLRNDTLQYHQECHAHGSKGFSDIPDSRNSQLQRFTGPHHIPHRLQNHRSLMTLRSHGGMENTNNTDCILRRPMGTIGLHLRGPSSIESRHSAVRVSKLGPGRNGYRSSAASSPASIAMRRLGPAYCPRINTSVPSLRSLPSPIYPHAQSFNKNDLGARQERCNFFQRRPLGEGVSWGSQLFTDRTDDETPRSAYYDYSESFVEDGSSNLDTGNGNHPHQYSVCWNVNPSQVTPNIQRAQTPFGTKIGSTFSPAELAADHKRSVGMDEASTAQVYGAKENMEDPEPATNILIAELPGDNDRTQATVQEPFELDANARRVSIASHRTCASSNSGVFFHKGERSQRHLATLAARVHSPSCDKKSEGRSSIPSKSMRPVIGVQASDTVSPEDKIPPPSAVPNRLLSPGPKLTEAFTSFAKASTDNDCPQPDRPVSSQQQNQLQQTLAVQDVSGNRTTAIPQASKGTYQVASDQEPMPPVETTTIAPQLEIRSTFHSEKLPCTEIQHCEASTPQKANGDSIAISHGKSTVESLLDRHIESLGLVPEPSDSSESSSQTSEERSNESDDTLRLRVQLQMCQTTSKVPTLEAGSYWQSIPNRESHLALKPTALFASLDSKISATSTTVTIPDKEGGPRETSQSSQESAGWQTLPSNSHEQSPDATTRPSVTSGELGDIDTDVYPLGKRIYNLSQLSLPTTLEPVAEVASGHSSVSLGRSRSEATIQQATYRKRHVKLGHERQPGFLASGYQLPRVDATTNPIVVASPPKPTLSNPTGYAELDGDRPAVMNKRLNPNNQKTSTVTNPGYFSLLSARPVADTSVAIGTVSRKLSTRTNRSHVSQNSQHSLLEPLNSTRQRSQVPRLGSTVPKLAPPDLGPSLYASTLDMGIPYAEAPSTIFLSHKDTRSFFDESPSRIELIHRGVKRQLGMRPSRGSLPTQRPASVRIKAGLPVRDGVPIAAVGPSARYPARKRSTRHRPTFNDQPIQYRAELHKKRNVVVRFKEWWRRQCMQRVVDARKARTIQSLPGGVLV